MVLKINSFSCGCAIFVQKCAFFLYLCRYVSAGIFFTNNPQVLTHYEKY